MNKSIEEETIVYPRVIEEIEEWPIYLLSQDRDNFVREIDDFAFNRLSQKHRKDISDVLVKTIYQERIRIKEDPWKVDPPNERTFWNKISNKLIKKSLDRDDAESHQVNSEILKKIIHRYSEEIVGTFKVPQFRFAQRFLTFLFSRLLNAAVSKSIRGLWRGRRNLYERIRVEGEIEKVRSIFDKGTVVVVPTHFSNLDSILVGYALDQIAGLPSFSYGAGLNLYNSGSAAYFMNRLGAYRVDRRKKNSIYLETLKSMSTLSIQRGVNTLFFPGGTRSRSGALETDLKMGLLGTAVEAQRAMSQKGDGKKVFIVPMVISYNFVLEAPFMIDQHLRYTGKENYIRLRDEGKSLRSWLMFIWKFFSTTSDIWLNIGRPMDVLGNYVNESGESLDQHGNKIEITEYFKSGSEITENRQREEEYTKLLADKLVERFHAENIVLNSHLVAFAVFKILLNQNPKLDLYGILRLPPDEYVFPRRAVEEVVEQMQIKLFEWEKLEKIKLSPKVKLSPSEVVTQGVKALGVFHREMPLTFDKNDNIVSQSFSTLYYYHNRLEHYNLEKYVHWKAEEIEVLVIDNEN
jgi:glycerol-3-phosphate O-acyltransferase